MEHNRKYTILAQLLSLSKQQTIKIKESKSRFVLGFDDNFAVAEQCSS